MADRAKLVRKRQPIRSSVTKIANAVDVEIGSPNPDIMVFQDAIAQLPDKLRKLEILDDEIETLTLDTDPALDAELDSVIKYNDDITRAISRSKHKLEEIAAAANQARVRSNSVSSSASESAPTVKLPKLQISKFDGNVANWSSFWSQYESAIHNNEQLNRSDKFSYLKTYLEGAAARAIAGLSLTAENYDPAIKILSERFGREDLIIIFHLNNFLNLTPVKKSSDVIGLRKFYDDLEVEIRSLQSLKIVTENYGILLCLIIIKLIPQDIALAFNRERDNTSQWDINKLLTHLLKEIASRERTNSVQGNESETKPVATQPKQSNFRHDHRNQKPISAANLNVGVSNKFCIYCEEDNHYPSECTKLTPQERRKIILQKNRCLICLRQRHQAKDCTIRNKGCRKCGKHHHTSICENSGTSNARSNNSEVTHTNSPSQVSSALIPSVLTANSAGAPKESGTPGTKRGLVLLQTAQVVVSNGDGKTSSKARVVLDNGSHLTYIREELSRQLNLQVIGEETLDVYRFASAVPFRITRRRVRMTMTNIHNPTKFVIVEAIETPEISGPVFSPPNAEMVAEMNRRGMQIADPTAVNIKQNLSVQILIGSDCLWEIIGDTFVRIGKSLVAIDSTFGWIMNGPTQAPPISVGVHTVAAMISTSSEDSSLNTQLRQFWELDAIGIHEEPSNNKDENQIIQSFQDTITFQDGRYSVSLPWKENRHELGDNLAVATKRTRNLLQKLKQDPAHLDAYHNIMQEQLQAGVIEEVKPDSHDGESIYYLPHRSVIRENHDTTKIRIVYDASSHAKDIPSLNDCLESGPNLNPELLNVLIRFRENRYAFTGDIEKAFLQIAIDVPDRDAFRFLWLENKDSPIDQPLKVYRFARVPFGATCSPFLLTATILHHLKSYELEKPDTCQILREARYVDDLATGADDIEKAYRLSKDAADVMKDAGMNLRKWKSNSPELRQLWGMETENTSQLSLTNTEDEKVLGLSWNLKSDSIYCESNLLFQYLADRRPTKRWVLKAVARIFDPLGLLAPFTIRAKILFQELWLKKLSWDSELPSDLARKFDAWCEEISDLRNIEIPRYYFNELLDSKPNTYELHTFVDASEKAYAASAYIRYRINDETFGTCLVASKTRVAPLQKPTVKKTKLHEQRTDSTPVKELTLPRLELMGALIGARLVTTLINIFSITPSRVMLWTDSTIALGWIRGTTAPWKPFVSNRVREIQSLTNPDQWNHVKGTDNPADLPTRGRTVRELSTSHRWWKGPEWLTKPLSLKPTQEIPGKEETNHDLTNELRNAFRSVSSILTAVAHPPEPVLDLARYSSLTKVYRVTGWIRRFLKNTKTAIDRKRGELSAEEIAQAEQYWVRTAQRDCFPDEVSSLVEGRLISKRSKLLTLSPVLDEANLICVGGRLTGSNLTYRERHPWVLDSKHRLSELIVKHHHDRIKCAGVNDTLIEVRVNFWILKARQFIKRIIHDCNRCKKFRVKRCTAEMAPLPSTRTTEALPFSVCGLDFAGPLYDKKGAKCYIALFTCAVTRAVHLELVTDMTADRFLLSFRRFICRRGIVQRIYSDNAKTFKRADKDLQELFANLRSPEVEKYFGDLRISWSYIVDRAAWWGGFWERLVRSVKISLRNIIGKSRLDQEELATALAEVESILNSRPISYEYQDAGEPVPLTPPHFLVGDRTTSIPSRTFKESDIPWTVGRKDIILRLKYRQSLLDRFWSRWKTDYLLELRSAHHRTKCNPTRELKPGDVVIIEEAKTPRLLWRIAAVEETYVGRDGIIRSCLLRLPNGTKLKRPIQLLYHLELS